MSQTNDEVPQQGRPSWVRYGHDGQKNILDELTRIDGLAGLGGLITTASKLGKNESGAVGEHRRIVEPVLRTKKVAEPRKDTASRENAASWEDTASRKDFVTATYDEEASKLSDVSSAEKEQTPEEKLETVREIILRRLEQRDYSRHELIEYAVRRRGCDRELAEHILDRLADAGLIDDAKFAKMWAESRQRSRGLSRRAVVQELRQKGVAEEFIDEAVGGMSHDDEWETALTLCRSKASRLGGLDRHVAMRRLSGFLARRGYTAGIAMAVVRQVLDEQSDVE